MTDAAPAAVVLLPLDDPAGRGVHRGSAQPARGDLAQLVQRLVQTLEGAVPTGHRGKRLGRVGVGRVGVQLVQREGGGADRALGRDDRQRHDGLTGPASEVVDVERHPAGEVDQLRREFGEVLPLPPAEQGEPDPGEDPGGGDAPALADPGRGPRHVRGVGRVTGQPEGDVRLDGRREFAGAAVEGGPGAVLALFTADEQGSGLCGLLVADPQELTEQQVLGVHGDVRLEVALPPSLGVLPREQEVGGPPCGAFGDFLYPGRRGGGDVGFAGRGCAGRQGRPGASVGRRCHGFPFVQSYESCCCGSAVGRCPSSLDTGRRLREGYSTDSDHLFRTTTKSASAVKAARTCSGMSTASRASTAMTC